MGSFRNESSSVATTSCPYLMLWGLFTSDPDSFHLHWKNSVPHHQWCTLPEPNSDYRADVAHMGTSCAMVSQLSLWMVTKLLGDHSFSWVTSTLFFYCPIDRLQSLSQLSACIFASRNPWDAGPSCASQFSKSYREQIAVNLHSIAYQWSVLPS